MERKFENKLENGLAYLEFKGCYTKEKGTQDVLRSKNGNLMMMISWSAVDHVGNVGSLYDYIVITDKAKFKIDNLENALGLPKNGGIFDYDTERFNLAAFGPWTSCGAAIENDERGPKIKRYVPLAFYKTIENVMSEKANNDTNGEKLSPTGIPESGLIVTNSKFPSSTDIDFGDLPF